MTSRVVWCLSPPRPRSLGLLWPGSLVPPGTPPYSRAPSTGGCLPSVSALCPTCLSRLLDCRADFLAPLPLFAWLLCASSQERISIRILRHIEMCPTTNSLSSIILSSSHPHQSPTSLPDTTPITVKQLHRRESVKQRL